MNIVRFISWEQKYINWPKLYKFSKLKAPKKRAIKLPYRAKLLDLYTVSYPSMLGRENRDHLTLLGP